VAAWVWLLLALAAGAAHAIRVTDVRVGVHDDYTRVVLETDASVDPTLEQSTTQLVLEVDAESTPRAVAVTKSPDVESVRVVPRNGGSEVRIVLRRPVQVERFSLQGPPRLVLDLSQAAAGQAAAVPEPEPPPAPAERPEDTAPAPGPAGTVPPPPMPEAEEPEVAEAPAPPPPSGAGTAEEPPAADAPPLAAGRLEREGFETEERELFEGGRVAATSPPEAGEEEAGAPEPPIDQPRPAPPPRPVPPPPSSGGPLGFLPAPFDQPVTLAIVLAVLLGLWMLARMLGRRGKTERLSPFDAEQEAEGPAAPLVPAAGETAPEHVLEEERGGGEAAAEDDELPAPWVRTTGSAVAGEGDARQPSIFDEPAPEADTGGGTMETPAGTATGDAGALGAAAAGAAAGRGAGAVDELERRLAHLEQRMEELVDAKERLERQVAAQTEELRVQRAAIARTQRVLRGMSRPEDEASEPVPR
jgi:hypothetical protein